MSWIAIDFETATSLRNSACSLGVALVEDGRLVHSSSWLIRPPVMHFEPYNIRVHGIRPEYVRHSPTFGELWGQIAPLFDGRTILAHNASFDVSVLRHMLAEYRLPWPDLEYYCTCTLSKRVWPGQKGYRLNVMAEMLGIRFCHHNAEEDALTCAKIALECCRKEKTPDLHALARRLKISRGRLVEEPERKKRSVVKPGECSK